MKAYIVENVLGTLALDEGGEVVDFVPFEGGVAEVAGKVLRLEEGELIEELEELLKRLSERGYKEVVVEDAELGRRIAARFEGVEVSVEPGNRLCTLFRSEVERYLKELGMDLEEYRKLLYEVSLEATKRKVREAAEKRDLFIAQAISAIDELNKTLNLFASRLREWYGLHLPEMDDIIDEHRDYVKIVYHLGSRDNFTVEALKDLGIPEGTAKKLAEAARSSMGASLTEFDLQAIRGLAKATLDLYELRDALEEYVDEAMKEVAPNVRGLVGPLLGARLIALAGGLSKLATLPASTIQVLGAEKALFRALRTGGRPPKHGVIFQYPEIHRAPRWQRGKIARALAAKLAIAARIDAFTGEYKAEELKEELAKRIQEIKTLYAKPPPRKAPPSRRGRRRRRGR